MDLSRRELLAAGVATVVTRRPAHGGAAAALSARAGSPARQTTTHPPNLPIRDYLSREARRMTDNALSTSRRPPTSAARPVSAGCGSWT